MNIKQIKEKILISDLLEKLGHTPMGRHRNKELVYKSPYREENTPSCFVNDETGQWYDHGDARGGNIIDLAQHVLKEPDIQVVVATINDMYNGVNVEYMAAKKSELRQVEKSDAHKLVKVQPLGKNYAITSYLSDRGVYDVAARTGLVKEVYYDYINDKTGEIKRYFGAGWENSKGGWEIRNKYGKIGIIDRDLTIKSGSTGIAHVFEGAMDYLTALREKTISFKDTAIILNGLGMYKRGLDYLKQNPHPHINLFLDNGKGGDKFTTIYQEHFPNAVDKRSYYQGYSDYNDKIRIDHDEKKSLSR